LKKEGFEVYILPVNNSSKGEVFRVTLGNFDSRQEAEDFGATIVKKRVSDYAKTIQLEMR
jgi:cell division septation protein DedD